jgi:hypothetical protein
MGYNTVVLVLNDALGDIQKDEKFGEHLVSAILLNSVDVEGHITRVKVLGQEHADLLQVWAVGGNTGILLGTAGCYDPIHTILHRVANDHGFRLVRDRDLIERAMLRETRCELCRKEGEHLAKEKRR